MLNDSELYAIDRGIICKYSFNKMSLLDVWNKIDVGNYAWCLYGNGDRSSKRVKLLDILGVIEVSEKFRDVFWTPNVFSKCDRASTKYMIQFKNVVLDLDDKVCPDFWNKIDELICIWNYGKSVMNIPCPDIGIFTGHGIHLYWNLLSCKFDEKVKLMVGVILNVLRLKFCSHFEGEFDPVSVFHFFRVPDSSTKDNRKVVAFEFNNAWSGGDIFSFSSQILDEMEHQILLDMVNGKVDYNNSVDLIIRKYSTTSTATADCGLKKTKSDAVSTDVISKTNKNIVPVVPFDMSVFKDDYLNQMFKWIEDDVEIVNKSFAKMVCFGLNLYAPIKKGFRNQRLFGLSVALSKSGASLNTIAGMVEVTNEILCYPPLFKHEIKNCYINSDIYNMRSNTLRGYLGFKRWPYFRDKKISTMSRKEAAANASELSNKKSLKSLFAYILVNGFNSSIVLICKGANISNQTFYRYKRKGIIYAMIVWMNDHNKFESCYAFNKLASDYKFEISDADYFKYYNMFTSFLSE